MSTVLPIAVGTKLRNKMGLCLPFQRHSQDISGKGNHATLAGTSWETSNVKIGAAALSLNGTSDYAVGPSFFGDVDFPNQAFTIVILMYLTGTTDYQAYMAIGVATASKRYINAIYVPSLDRLDLHFHRSDNSPTDRAGIHAEPHVLEDAWLCMAFTHDGGGTVDLTATKIYKEAVSIADTAPSLGNWGAYQSNQYRVGRSGGADYGECIVNGVAAWDRVLSDIELKLINNNGLGMSLNRGVVQPKTVGGFKDAA